MRVGSKHSPETRAKISAALKGVPKTLEHRAAAAAAKRGIMTTDTRTPEHREKNRQGQIRRYSDPAERIKRGELTRASWLKGHYDKRNFCWGKPGIHAGVKMRCLNSEGVFAQDCDRADIVWQYEPHRFKLSWCSYTPDFYLSEFNIWVEIKGYPGMPGNWEKKVESFRCETGKTLIVVYQCELSSLRYVEGGE